MTLLNITEILDKMIDTCPEKIRGKMSFHVHPKYRKELGKKYKGFKIVSNEAMPEDKIILQ